MVKHRKKLNKSIIPILIISLVIILSVFIYTSSNSETNYYTSKDFGIIKITTSITEGLGKYFKNLQQAVTFSKTTGKINENIAFTDSYTIPALSDGKCFIGALDIVIRGPVNDKTLSFNPTPVSSGNVITTTSSFKTNITGTYNARSFYYEGECANGICSSTTQCGASYPKTTTTGDPSTNAIVISETLGSCSLSSICSDFADNPTLSNNVRTISTQTCQKPDKTTSDCQLIFDKDIHKTTCKEGYYIEGTQNVEGSGILNCVIATNNNECSVSTQSVDCGSNERCDNNNNCVPKSCDVDSTQICNDNSTVILGNCVNEILISTTNTCPNTNNTTNNNTSGKVDCFIIDETLPEESFFGDLVGNTICKSTSIIATSCNPENGLFNKEEDCVSNARTDATIKASIIGGLGLLFVIGGIIIFIRVRK